MNDFDDRLESFLRKNRPEVPPAPKSEFALLLSRVKSPIRTRSAWSATAAVAAALVLVIYGRGLVYYPGKFHIRDATSPFSEAGSSEELVSFALDTMNEATESEEFVFEGHPLALLVE